MLHDVRLFRIGQQAGAQQRFGLLQFPALLEQPSLLVDQRRPRGVRLRRLAPGLQRGHVVFPKSTTPSRIAENFDLFDFELSDDELARIDALNVGEEGRIGPHPDTFDYVPS